MRAIRSFGNRSTELRLRALLVSSGIRGWRLQERGLPGTPDFFFRIEKIAVFVDGCFWHGCPTCRHAPSIRADYWRQRIERNRERDLRASKNLRASGISVVRIWECKLASNPTQCLERIQRVLVNRPKAVKGARSESALALGYTGQEPVR